LQALELRKPPKSDVEGALQFCGFLSVQDDVCKDAALGGFLHVSRVFRIDERNDGARSLMDDLRDLLERVLAIEAQPHERDLCVRASTERPDLTDVDGAPNDLMAEGFDQRRNPVESVVLLVSDQHLQDGVRARPFVLRGV
jgi:hypothetical protein